ncbi:uncharacterized protein LOC105917551 [Fundulus heteroclitus]|uniref:uncharacterized protein LOC105917551 n=1 Tax=Fundulus heteroclitus TaxID=8078 RepID=UPI00165ACA3C|nr:uncharacterized protein LOC105917551 [Fundulus heteroclitus]
MANNTTTHASYIQEDPLADENIPPERPNPADSSEFENAALNKMERIPSGGNDVNVFDAHVFSTPVPKNKSGEGQVASRLTGFPSALTPVLRYLNIGNKSPSPELFKHPKPPNLSVPSSFPAANCQKSAGESRRRISDEDFSMINDECLPEMTFCDLSAMQLTTNDSVLPDSLQASPHPYGTKTHLQTRAGDQNSLSELPPLSTDYPVRVDRDFETNLSSHGLIDNYLQDITLLELTQDLELSPVDQTSSVDFTPVLSPAGRLQASDHSEQILTELGKSDTITNEELSVTSVNSAQCAVKASLDVTQDVTMGRTLENSGSSDTSARAINVTHDLTSSCNISSSGINGSIPGFYSEPREKPGSVEMEVLQTSGETTASRDGSQQNPESDTGGQEVEMSENSDADARAINVTHDLNSSCKISASGINGSIPEFYSEPAMEVSRDGSQQSPESDTGGQEVEKYQNPDGDSLCTKAINITREINHEASALSATLSSWTTDGSIPGLEPEPKGTPHSAELPPGCGTESTSKESRQSPTSDVSNGQFTVERASAASPPVCCHNNETLDLPTADGGESGEQQSSDSVKTEASCVKNESTVAVEQDASFHEVHLQKPKIQMGCASGKTPASLGHRINASDCKPPSEQNATITLSEMSSSVTQQSCLGNASAPKAVNLTTTLKEECSENHASKLQRNEPDAKTDGSPSRTSDARPALEPAAASGGCERRDGSQSGLQAADDVFDLSNQESLDSITSKTHTFNLDETLDLRAEISSTSTPMPNCKMFTFESKREAGQGLAPQRKLYGNLPNMASEKAPSSIVCERKTFLPPSAPKHLLPPSKPAGQLLTSRPPTAATGLPVKRHRPEGDSGKSAASEEQRGKTSLSSSYNLRSLASKLPVSGLQRPQRSGIPVGFPKTAPGPRTAVSSSTEKLSGSTGLLKAANPVTKAAQGKKHPLTKGEPLPLSKKKKMDKLVQSSNADAPASGCDSANGVKALKLRPANQRSAPDKASKPGAAVPASTAKTVTPCDASRRGSSLKPPVTNQRARLTGPQSHIAGCARCDELEQENRLQSQEIQKLKEELLKWKTQLNC